MAGPDRLDRETREVAFGALLAEHPEAQVGAIGPDGLFVPVPDSLAIGVHPVLQGRSALDLVVPADRVVVIEAWERVKALGASRAPVRLAGDAGSGVLHFVDAQDVYGVFVGVLIAESAAHAETVARVASLVPPRLCRIRKDEVAVVKETDEATAKLLGWEPGELVGRRSLEIVHPDDADRAIANWMEMLSTPGAAFRWRGRHRHRDGSWIWFEVTNHNRLDDPEHADVLAEMVDISDEMAVQEALRAREQLLHTLAEALPVGVFQVDRERNVLYANDRLHEILGTGPATTCDAQLTTLLPEHRGRVADALDLVLRCGADADVEVALRLPVTGEERLCTMTIRALVESGVTNGAVVCVSDVTEAARMRDELQRRATFDGLTGCHNRSAVIAELEATLVRREDTPGTAVTFVDVDGFKSVNDTLGHGAGDELLGIVASRLRNTVRDGDVVGRIGGDEFLVISPRVDSPSAALALGERLAAALRQDAVLTAASITPRASIGVAWSDEPLGTRPVSQAAETLVAEADEAMYESKRAGNGDAVLFRPRPVPASRAS